jgi:hypothetical protein
MRAMLLLHRVFCILLLQLPIITAQQWDKAGSLFLSLPAGESNHSAAFPPYLVPPNSTDITLSLAFPPGAAPSVTAWLEFSASPAAAPAGPRAPFSLFCGAPALMLHAGVPQDTRRCSLRVPLLDARVRRECASGGCPGTGCYAHVRVEARQLPAGGQNLTLGLAGGVELSRCLPDNAFVAAVEAFEPVGAAAEDFFGMLHDKLDEVLMILLCPPLAVYSQSVRGDRVPALAAPWVFLRTLASAVLWVRAGGALLKLEVWADFYLACVLLSGALVLHDKHAGDGASGAGVGVWVWHALLAGALAARRLLVAAPADEDAEEPKTE